MANLRVIKKDIDYIVSEIVEDAFFSLQVINDEKKEEELVKIINEAFELRETLLAKVNHPSGTNLRAYYREISNELLTTADSLFERIGER